jgi:tetratricopeptide (TPR) repeat protein
MRKKAFIFKRKVDHVNLVNSYKTVLGLKKGESVFQTPDIMKNYSEIKSHVQDHFNQKNPQMSFDFEKKIYVDEIQQYYSFVVDAYISKNCELFTEKMNKIAYLALIKDEFQLAMKTYNLMGHVFMTWKQFNNAYQYFKKMKDVSRMDHDLEAAMYAFKQMGYCLNQLKEYQKATRSFKCQLQLAWHLGHLAGEMTAYENLAIANFYLGRIDKSQYYL